MTTVADYVKDEQFLADFEFTRTLVHEALRNDPVLAAMDNAMPLATKPPDEYHCFAGECPIGNLFTDAARWKVQADVAIINAGGVRGPGWDAGEIHVSDMWAALPFANMLCEATVSGLSLVRLFNYSTSMAAYENRYVQDADRFMQVSGVRVTYNTKLPSSGRLIAVDIWDDEKQEYAPVERLKLYKLATSSWECSGFYPFNELLGANLTMEGEIPASTTEELMQDVVGQYLAQLNTDGISYNASIQGRLVNNTDALEPMDWDQTESSCSSRTYWVQKLLTCMECPSTERVDFSQDITLTGESNVDQAVPFEATLLNGENFTVKVIPKSVPSWVTGDKESSVTLRPSETHSFKFQANAVRLDAGTAQATVSFAIQDGGSFPGCGGNDVDFQVSMRVAPTPELNKPENIVIAGFVLMGIVCITAISFSLWLFLHSDSRTVKARQPELYFVFFTGCLVLSLSILPLSIADDLDSWDGRNKACMAIPWLLFTGFNMTISSLYAKLWRINKIFFVGVRYRRIAVTVKDALVVFGSIFVVNLCILLVWTIVDPLQWEIRNVPGEPWNRYGSCSDFGPAGRAMFGLAFALTAINLCLAAFQAFKARKISDDYSESRQLAFAVLTTFQIIIVSVPILFLISEDNPDAKYLLQVLIIFAVCMSLMLAVFIPILRQYWDGLNQHRPSTRVSVSGILNPRAHGGMFSSDGDLRSDLTSLKDRPRSSTFSASNLRNSGIVTANQNCDHPMNDKASGVEAMKSKDTILEEQTPGHEQPSDDHLSRSCHSIASPTDTEDSANVSA